MTTTELHYEPLSQETSAWQVYPYPESKDYTFSGQMVLSEGIRACLNESEIHAIYSLLRQRVAQEGAIGAKQYFVSSTGKEVLCIDTLAESVKNSREYSAEEILQHDHFVMFLGQEQMI